MSPGGYARGKRRTRIGFSLPLTLSLRPRPSQLEVTHRSSEKVTSREFPHRTGEPIVPFGTTLRAPNASRSNSLGTPTSHDMLSATGLHRPHREKCRIRSPTHAPAAAIVPCQDRACQAEHVLGIRSGSCWCHQGRHPSRLNGSWTGETTYCALHLCHDPWARSEPTLELYALSLSLSESQLLSGISLGDIPIRCKRFLRFDDSSALHVSL